MLVSDLCEELQRLKFDDDKFDGIFRAAIWIDRGVRDFLLRAIKPR